MHWVGGAGHHDARLLPGPLQHHRRVLQPRLSAAEVHHPDLVRCICRGGGGVPGVRHPAAVCFHPHGPEAGQACQSAAHAGSTQTGMALGTGIGLGSGMDSRTD